VPDLQRLVLGARRTGTTAQCFVASLLPTSGIVLVDASGHLRGVRFSRDSCGLPDPIVLAALGRRPWIRLPG
jgi:hypothetical protein